MSTTHLHKVHEFNALGKKARTRSMDNVWPEKNLNDRRGQTGAGDPRVRGLRREVRQVPEPRDPPATRSQRPSAGRVSGGMRETAFDDGGDPETFAQPSAGGGMASRLSVVWEKVPSARRHPETPDDEQTCQR